MDADRDPICCCDDGCEGHGDCCPMCPRCTTERPDPAALDADTDSPEET